MASPFELFWLASLLRILKEPEQGESQEGGSPFFSFVPPFCKQFRRLRGGRVLRFVGVRPRMVFLDFRCGTWERERES